jgi:hypothetical protein
MRIKEVKVYKFDELSDKVKDKVIENLSDINTDYDWYESIYEDAGQIDLEITGFDLYHREISGKFLNLGSAEDCANVIVDNHGSTTETYKTASAYLSGVERWKENHSQTEDDDLEEHEALDREFLHSLLQDYLFILQKSYDYQTSRKAIIETIEANEYEFEENGKLA